MEDGAERKKIEGKKRSIDGALFPKPGDLLEPPPWRGVSIT
jgi:hypothetical protein